MRLRQLRTEIVSRLSAAGDDEASADAAVLIMNALNIDKTHLLLGEDEVGESDIKRIYADAERAAEGEPVQYITGRCEFMSLEFEVCHGVLIPRADTEVLVEAALKRLPDRKAVVWDLCCGSGCVGLSVAAYNKNVTVTLADVSDTALEVSARNAEKLGISRRVRIVKSDVLRDNMSEAADAVVSNPPYIRRGDIDCLEKKVRGYEPRLALDGGEDGLMFYRRIASAAKIKSGGFIAFEIGYDQGRDVEKILRHCGYIKTEIIADTEGRSRVVCGMAPY